MIFLKRAFFLLLAMLAFSGSVSAALSPLIDPTPVIVPPGVNEETIVHAIKRGLAAREWLVIGERPGSIDADLNVRNKHHAVIRIDYNEREITIRYVSSINLDYSETTGMPMIHRNYPRWINFLREDIDRFVRIGPFQ